MELAGIRKGGGLSGKATFVLICIYIKQKGGLPHGGRKSMTLLANATARCLDAGLIPPAAQLAESRTDLLPLL